MLCVTTSLTDAQIHAGWGGWIRTLVNRQLNIDLFFQHIGRSTLYQYVGADEGKSKHLIHYCLICI
jgi:hypothetical protein